MAARSSFAAPPILQAARRLSWWTCVLAFAACGQLKYENVGGAGQGVGGAAVGGAAGGMDGAAPSLSGSPLLFAPTSHGIGISAALATGDPSTLRARLRKTGATAWGTALVPESRAVDLAQWDLEGLAGGTTYEYQISALGGGESALYQGRFVTARAPGAAFSFALVSDTHIGADLSYGNQGDPTTLSTVSTAIGTAAPDFVVNLGDMLDFHEYGFNVPPPDGSVTRMAYLNYRRTFGDAVANAAHFPVIGGWDSESGCNTLDEINRSRDQRLLYLPGPSPQTYPEGGSPFQDYYAFTWGDALFVVLNVYTYTPTCHLLSGDPGLADDWTLGDAQLAWLQNTLANATAKWRFLLIHHPVGGNAGDDDDSAYGRGGGRAAQVGQQALVHQLMQDHGVQILFYGHDHVFTDMTVDKTHYSLPGSAGAIWFFPTSQTGYTEDWEVPGWGKVDVTPGGVHVQYLDLTGQILYEYSLD
ncbi:MAG TPA: metallophosphoesterase [Polyangia bacterium]|jgi:3',5'-cyclic AMP phosphodiesterase CpdA